MYCSNSHDMNLYRMTDSHVKLNIFDDMQECLNNSHHRIALEYYEDTLSLVVDLTLSTSDILSPKTPIPLLGMHQPLNMSAMRSRMTHLDSITIGLRSRFLNRNHP